jgi:hypothetical protein
VSQKNHHQRHDYKGGLLYLENELFDRGFKNAIKRFFKGKRNRLKARFSQRLTMCFMNSQLDKWERLKEYQSTLLVKKK